MTDSNDQAIFQRALSVPGTKVRKRFNPAMVGVCTGKVEGDADDLEVQVSFNGQHPEWELADNLELINERPLDPVTMLLAGQAGRARDLRRELARSQLSGRLSEVFYSMDTTNTEFMPHQFKPVLAMLESPSQGLLIADEVGLGKTIEAGLIWTELRFRKNAKRMLVVCPAMLTEKWRLELKSRFATQATEVSAGELFAALDDADPVQSTQCFICSLQGVRPPRDWDDEQSENGRPAARLARKLQQAASGEPLFDLTIIDEAHYLRNMETASATLGELLRPVSEHLVLLSATPINTKSSDLFSLLRLVDPDQFRFEHEFSAVLEANRPLVRATNLLRQPRVTPADVLEELDAAKRSHVLRNMEQLRLLHQDLSEYDQAVPLTPVERVSLSERVEGINLLGHVLTRSRKREVFKNRVIRVATPVSVEMTRTERDTYGRVTEAVRAFAVSQGGVEGFLLATPQRQLSSSMPAAAMRWSKLTPITHDQAELIFDAFGADVEEMNVSPLIATIGNAVRGVDIDALVRDDSKFGALHEILKQFFNDHPAEKVVVFSYFRDTLAYLHDRLKECGISSVVVKGGDRKVELIESFEKDPNVRVLLSSEVAAEGVDLQFMRVLINYDLPWNPMKVEQRIGRIDRIGQRADKIVIFNLVYGETIDDRILSKLFLRLDLFEQALGGLDEVLGREVATLTKDLLSGRLTPEEEEARIIQTAAAIEQQRLELMRVEEHEADLIGLGDLIRKRIDHARASGRRVSDQDLLHYIQDFLDRYAPGHVMRQDATEGRRCHIRLPPKHANDLSDYCAARRLPRTRLATRHEVEVWIENHVGKSSHSQGELINQFHPLIGFITEKLRADEHELPAVALEVSSAKLNDHIGPGLYAFRSELWSFSGARTDDFLRAAFVDIQTKATAEGQVAVDILTSLRVHGTDCNTYMELIDSDEQVLACLDHAQRTLLRGFRDESRLRRAENDDRIRLQRESIERNFRRRDARLENLLASARTSGLRVAKANIARYNKEREQLAVTRDLQMARLDDAAVFAPVQIRGLLGLLKVT
ncbi:MAG TPA: helicase [Gammaproteobacteria bacterium]|nr:helicase [Gammaproteobacteria bacterium]